MKTKQEKKLVTEQNKKKNKKIMSFIYRERDVWEMREEKKMIGKFVKRKKIKIKWECKCQMYKL